MSTQLESIVDPNTTDLVDKLVFAYSCALCGFRRYPNHRDRERARTLITPDPNWSKVGLPSKSDVASLLKAHGIAMPDPLED